MNTLWQQLKPEYKQKLEKEAIDYPSLVSSVVNSLKDNYLWSHLTIGQAKEFIQFTDYSYGSLSSYDWSFGERFFIADE